MGMSGMNLVSATFQDGAGQPGRKETAESSIDSSSPQEHSYGGGVAPPPPPLPHGPPHPNSATSDAFSETGSHHSAPHSPAGSEKHIGAGSTTKGGGAVSRPPGISVAPLPSPIGKPGHSKNTSATSPLLTLTPNSSVDGNSDWHSMGARTSPPFQGSDVQVPSLPFLQGGVGGGSDHRRGGSQQSGDDGAASLGSFDLNQEDNDGLLGLEALRDRGHTPPGPVQMISTSPPVARGYFPPHSSNSSTGSVASSGHQHYSVDGRVEKPRPRERPPLSSYAYQEGQSVHHGDRNPSGAAPGFLPPGQQARVAGGGIPDPNSLSFDSNGGLGAIGRPDLRQTTSDFDLNRRRASSQDNYHNPYGLQQQQQYQQNGFQDPSQKFGSLPSLSSHVQQQHRMPYDASGELQKPRHVRSISTPMMPNNGSAQQVPAGVDSRFYQAAMQQEGHSYPGESKYKSVASQPSLSSSYDANPYSNQKRVSMPNLGGYGEQPGYPNLPRRDVNHDYQMNPHGDARSYSSAGISPAHSPMQAHYGGHSRQSSAAGSAMLSSSPRSVGGMSRGGGSMGSGMVHPGMPGDEDLTHPLVGEHIDVPDHDDMHAPGGYGMNQALPPYGMHQQRHSHSSMDQMLPQSHLVESPHHLPTAGAALPMPKVVYAVKFKRTQRNFVLGPRIQRDLKIGTYVKVEADRGEDLGIVVGKVAADKLNFSGRSSFSSMGIGPPSAGMGGGDLKRIIRLATHDEVSLLSMKRDEEEELLQICRAKVRQRGLPMHVVDAEYQFDRHKLTFFFEAEGRVDFRELVRDLFSMYKTRIWMQQLDKNTSTSAPAMVSPSAASLQIDYGTPIIAPMSEFADSVILGGLSAGDR